MAMPVNVILVIYVILCILSYNFNKLTMLYIHVHISISMTNKSGLTFYLSIKYLSVYLPGTPWDENLIYMKLYNLLILTENTKKSKNNFKAPKKGKIVVFSRSYIAM